MQTIIGEYMQTFHLSKNDFSIFFGYFNSSNIDVSRDIDPEILQEILFDAFLEEKFWDELNDDDFAYIKKFILEPLLIFNRLIESGWIPEIKELYTPIIQ
jgi:hypothetical protein